VTLYIAIFVPLALLAFIEAGAERFRRRDSVAISVVFLLIFWAMAWLRWERGTDWMNYLDFFNTNTIDFETATGSGYEWGFGAINYLVHLVTDDYTVLLFILSTVLFMAAGAAILKSSRRPIVATLVFFCCNVGFIFFTRQGIAVVFALLAAGYIVRGSKWGFLLSVLAGALFHYSILVFLPAWWIYRLRIKTPHFVVVIVCGIVLAVAVSRMAVGALSGLPGFVGVKLAGYLESGTADFEGFGQSVYRVLAGGLFNRGGLLLLAMLVVGRRRGEDECANGMINLYAFNLILFLMMAPIAVSLTRFASYYDALAVFLIPVLYDHVRRRSNRWLLASFLTLYLAYRLFYGALGGLYGELFVPYNSVFTKQRYMILF
jgi:hypothetical protein